MPEPKKGAGVQGTAVIPKASTNNLSTPAANALIQTIGAGVTGTATIPPAGTQPPAKKDDRTWLEKMIGVDLASVVFFMVGFGLIVVGLLVLFAVGAKSVADNNPELVSLATKAAAAAAV